MQKHWKRQAMAIFLLPGIVPVATAALLDEEELSQAYGDRPTVSIATGSSQPVARAPSVATVLTAADIESMGARDLDEVLAQVPGLHVTHTFGSNPVYSFRGIHSQYNQQVLMLINGVPMTSVFVGDRGNVWGGFPVDNIARIEVVRGPASALHGADALAGVISIYTKDPDFRPGTTTRVDAGSFNTYSASLRHAGQIGDLGMAAYLRMGRTTGNDATISADAQTALDQTFGTQASLAPGPMTSNVRAVDAAIDLVYEGLQFRSAYKKRGDVGTGPGIAEALDPQGRNSSELLTADLGWSNPKLTQNLSFSAQAQFADRHEFSNLTLYPPGAFNGAFPDGMIGRPEKWERRNALSTHATYSGWKNHRTRLGLGYVDQDIYRTREEKNYDFVYVMGVGYVPVPLGGIQDVSDSAPFLRPHGRILRYAYLQDEWQISPDLALTGGLRQDSYSDFGRTTNPRLALVWETSFSVTSKLLYGRAFRPPSFAESYNINNPVATGNSTLKPETIETIEAAIAWQIAPRIQLGFNVFHYEMEDILRFVPNSDPTTGNTAQNAGRQVGKGFELEGSWDVSSSLKLAGNFSHQYAKDPDSGRRAANVPRNRVYLRADWQFTPGWWLGPQMTYVGQRTREASDARAPLDGYTLLDVALRNTGLIPGSTLTVSVRNLADADAYEPSPAPGRIPNDFPLAGRSIFMNLTHSF